jgi:basic membrane protein A
MKKFFLFNSLMIFAFALAACRGTETFEIALITDYGDIDDESFNQGTWEGIVAFAEANNKTFAYYRPAEVSDAAYLDAIELAIEAGARIVVTPGFLFQASVGQAQSLYPDIKFVLIDAIPTGGTGDNTVSVLFAEHESGFLAGYAAVQEGFRSLGFMGGIPVPAVVRFGVGYIAGAYYAAQELDVEISFPANRYVYLGTFGASDAVRTRAASWYQDGIDVIFAAAGGAGTSVMSAAEASNDVMIGVDVDQSYLSTTVITSAMKDLASAVEQTLAAFYDDSFPGGEVLTLGASNNGVALPNDFSRFTNFTATQYDTIFNLLATGAINVPASHTELVSFFSAQGIEGLQISASDITPDS